MRPGPVFLLSILTCCSLVQAEPDQSLAITDAAQAQSQPTAQAQAEQPGAAPQAISSERDSAQLQRLRQENQRLKLQLKKAQAQAPQALLSEQQMWFATGTAAGLLGVILGALLRNGRRSRREWLN